MINVINSNYILKGGPRGGPALRKAAIVCPASLCANWRAECHKWLGSVRLLPSRNHS